ncbi:MAG: hypothetical protein JRN52_12665 [Nitrososphaerota archaeon]|nr:hypothetical protein [Nitrososphaerota archaeon]
MNSKNEAKISTTSAKSLESTCAFCELFGEVADLDGMDPKDEMYYLIHLKKSHGLVR